MTPRSRRLVPDQETGLLKEELILAPRLCARLIDLLLS